MWLMSARPRSCCTKVCQLPSSCANLDAAYKAYLRNVSSACVRRRSPRALLGARSPSSGELPAQGGARRSQGASAESAVIPWLDRQVLPEGGCVGAATK